MSEATATETGVPAEVTAQVNSRIDELKKMDIDGLIAVAAENGAEYKADDVNEKWLLRKVSRLEQARILKENGVTPPESHAKNDEATDAAQPTEGEAKKKGRKRMSTAGDFRIVLADGQSAGRDGSTKHKIVTKFKDVEKFTYDEFSDAVAEIMQWDAANETFGVSTKFKDLNAATRAWFSELKNKQEIIHPFGTPAAAETE